MTEVDLDDIIPRMSLWLKRKEDWHLQDGSLREISKAEKEGLYYPPNLFFTLKKHIFKKAFKKEDAYGIIIILGPRRVGKTSTLKYLVYKSIKEGKFPDHFVYVTLDREEFFLKEEKKVFLTKLISYIVERFTKRPLFIILDEVTFLKGWARALKNLIDEGTIGDGIIVIATGSVSAKLASAKRELSGRMGELGGEYFLFPRSFKEVLELGLPPSKDFFREIGKWGQRKRIIEAFLGIKEWERGINILKSLIKNYLEEIRGLFLEYLVCGGYPRLLYDSLKKKKISDERYYEDIRNPILNDAIKFNIDRNSLLNVIKSLAEYPVVKKTKEKLAKTLSFKDREKYLNYLLESHILGKVEGIKSIEKETVIKYIKEEKEYFFKLFFIDPAVFWAFKFDRNIYELAHEKLDEIRHKPNIFGPFLEAVVYSHIFRNVVSKFFDGLGLLGRKESEAPDVLAWYVSEEGKLVKVPIEVKVGKGEVTKEVWEILDKYSIKERVIVLSAAVDDIIEEERYIEVPIEIFLAILPSGSRYII